jgi:heme-degrading monooxygenase HmoA
VSGSAGRVLPWRKKAAVHARSTTIQARPGDIDEGIRYITEEVMPAITEMEGCVGLSMLVNRESGRCIATSAWTDEMSMRASDSAVRGMRDEAGSILGGSPQVDEWEIAVLHRDHRTGDSTNVRCTWLKCDPARLDEAIELFRSQVLPTAEGMSGFCSASLMVDRRSGRAVSSVTWDSRQAMEASRDAASELRATIAKQAGAEVEDVAEFEMVLAHLRVPELV